MIRSLSLLLALTLTLGLAGCESAEEKAARHYQSAVTLLEEGDMKRALVELRNVLRFDRTHRDALELYAHTLYDDGRLPEAYRQYLRLVEIYPDALEGRIILAELAFLGNNWDELERHGRAAIDLAPEDLRVRAIAVALAYREARLGEDASARDAAVAEARALLEENADQVIPRQIVIDSLVTGEDPTDALPEVEAALERDPENLQMLDLRFRLLVTAERLDEAGAQLEAIFELDSDNEDVQQTLVNWYVARGDTDSAEALLRRLAGPDEAEDTAGHILLIRFLEETKGEDAALAEINRLIEVNDGTPVADIYRALAAVRRFEAGERDEAIAQLQGVVDGAEEPSDETRRLQVMLAQMLNATGNAVGARAQIEEVIAADPSNVEALKFRASWAIDEDRPGDAISDLRTASSQAPRDPQIMSLMARAYERDGNAELAGERLAAAVDAANRAPAESLNYARFLIEQGRPEAARSVVADARRITPSDLGLIQAAGELALQSEDWTTIGELRATLAAIGTEDAATMASDLETAQLARQNRTAELISAMEEQAARGGSEAVRAVSIIVLNRLQQNDAAGARAALDEAMEAEPDSLELQLLDANLKIAEQDLEGAEAGFRALLEADPGNPVVVRRLYDLLVSQNRSDEAEAVLEAALEARPDQPVLMLMDAQRQQNAGNIEDAIEIYEALYARDSSNLIVANNLASLLADWREDPEDLERAEAIARRLRGREIPAFQDTYGWIAYRREDLATALDYLEPAAAGMPNDPLVQYHLGMTYLGLDRIDEAREVLARAIEIAGPENILPQITDAEERLASLPAEGDAAPEGTQDGPAPEEASEEDAADGSAQAAEPAPEEAEAETGN